MNNKPFIAVLVIIILVFLIFIYIIGVIPKIVMKVGENDFEVLGIEYYTTYDYDGDTLGAVNLSVETKIGNIIIGAYSETNQERECTFPFSEAGTHQMTGCVSDPAYQFIVYPIDIEHEFRICAVYPWSQFYDTKPTCKSITLPPYQE